ncbi:hypothetical protein SAMN05192583_2796 [Sphingomonas gellani]|uniref:Capsule biosynthesis protein n=1 Tax=Sphingomonas gellani TaxID=1166340 RepID=A0A1H8GK86_9SPHN|nr:DUF6356 family protein [Sphingomonas gellani]SEN44373.1 hypothetical protein SAMN05192583_2796 [Sphingomonas gellani]
MIDTLFTRHPRSVGESYGEHARVASGFGFQMIRGGLACLVHAVVPGLCTTTGSDTIRRLHARMGARRPATVSRVDAAPAWQLTYEI